MTMKIWKTYKPLDATSYLKASCPERLSEIRPGETMFPFFVELLEEPFKQWVIEIFYDKNKDSFKTMLDLVPKDVTDKQIKKLEKKLNKLIQQIIDDIINIAVDNTK